MKNIKMNVSRFRSEPTKNECYEAVWSKGSSCKSCEVECYRKGWPKLSVDADNRKRVNPNKPTT